MERERPRGVSISRSHGDKCIDKWTGLTFIQFDHEGVLGVGESRVKQALGRGAVDFISSEYIL